MIEAVGTPYNGSKYILTCVVIVDDSVDTDITISSQWMLPTDTDITDNTISDSSERVGAFEQRHNLTLRPLRSGDTGIYVCTAAINPEERPTFIVETSSAYATAVTVQSKLNLCF